MTDEVIKKEMDVFNVDALREKVSLGGKDLILEPLNLNGVKKLIDVIDASVGQLSKLTNETTIKEIANLVLARASEIMTILFPQDQYPFMTQEFIDSQMTIPWARYVLTRAVTLNGLEDIYPFLKGKMPTTRA